MAGNNEKILATFWKFPNIDNRDTKERTCRFADIWNRRDRRRARDSHFFDNQSADQAVFQAAAEHRDRVYRPAAAELRRRIRRNIDPGELDKRRDNRHTGRARRSADPVAAMVFGEMRQKQTANAVCFFVSP